jgi:hypothetical protein
MRLRERVSRDKEDIAHMSSATVQERTSIQKRAREVFEQILEDPTVLEHLEKWRRENYRVPAASDWMSSEA